MCGTTVIGLERHLGTRSGCSVTLVFVAGGGGGCLWEGKTGVILLEATHVNAAITHEV